MKILISIFSFLVLLYSFDVLAQKTSKRPPALSSSELQKRAENVYNEMQNQADIAPAEIKLIKSQEVAKKENTLKQIQDAVSGSSDDVSQIYKSAISASIGAIQEQKNDVYPSKSEVVRAVVAPKPGRLDSWVQRSEQNASSAGRFTTQEEVKEQAEENASLQDLFNQINAAVSQEPEAPSLPVNPPL